MRVCRDRNGPEEDPEELTAVSALARIAERAPGIYRVYCDRPVQDREELLTFLHSALRIGLKPGELRIVTSNPGHLFLRALSEDSLGAVGVEVPRTGVGESIDHWTVEEARRGFCPELHVRTAKEVELSVCGAHRDRMVVSTSHMGQWCLADHRTCPHKIRKLENRNDYAASPGPRPHGDVENHAEKRSE